MKKFLLLMVTLLCMQASFASDADAVNLKIKMSGTAADNRYFLCLPDTGCLSILAAQNGKVYTIYHDVKINGIFITDVDDNFRVNAQDIPASCNTTVAPGHTLTVYGHISKGPNQSTDVQGLGCSVS